ncbi:unnamed protein product [Ambrosiozyma monospora]|uniref:Unnamed protein product n=1 Tax=Ambrosiozyma monospora TaxID=43982 RepID=A0ACB5SZJ1_AMBMO|nr:unnamed protein product [Ambrosiozyma monospora]
MIKNKVLNWENFFLNVSIRIATIKKRYYFADEVLKNKITLQDLQHADVELRVLKVEIDTSYDKFMDKERYDKDHSFHNLVDFTKYLVQFMMLNELLEVNRQMSVFMKYQEWISACYKTCYECAKTLIADYTSTKVPKHYKKPWFVIQSTITAGIFLLVDCMLNKQIIRYQKTTIALVETILPVLSSYKQVIRPAIRGVYVIQKLINLMLGTDRVASISQLRAMANTKQSVVGTDLTTTPILTPVDECPDIPPISQGSPILKQNSGFVEPLLSRNKLGNVNDNESTSPAGRNQRLQKSTCQQQQKQDERFQVPNNDQSYGFPFPLMKDGVDTENLKSQEVSRNSFGVVSPGEPSSGSSSTSQTLRRFNLEQRQELKDNPIYAPIDTENIYFHHSLTMGGDDLKYSPTLHDGTTNLTTLPNIPADDKRLANTDARNSPNIRHQIDFMINGYPPLSSQPVQHSESGSFESVDKFYQDEYKYMLQQQLQETEKRYDSSLRFTQSKTVEPQQGSSSAPHQSSDIEAGASHNNKRHLYSTILGIIGDSGWEQFLDTIDDLSPSFDLK